MSESVAGTGPALHVGWAVPSFVVPLPVDVTEPDDLADRVVELARTVLAERDAEDQHLFAQMLLRQSAQLIDADVTYAGMCFVEHDDVPTMATLLVSQVPALGATVEEAADFTEAELKRRYRLDDIGTVTWERDGDGTPAVVRTGALAVSLPPELSPDGQAHEVRQNVRQVFVPLPGQSQMLVFELSSPSLDAWDMYVEMFTGILDTLDWATDEEVAEQEELARIAGMQPLAQAPAQDPAPEPVDESVAHALRLRSSSVLDGCGMRGRIREEADRLARVPCASCRPKGLTSGCTTEHHWEMDNLRAATLQQVVTAAHTHLIAQGWTEEVPSTAAPFGRAPQLTLSALGDAASVQGYVVSLTADAEGGRLLVDVSTACTRTTATTLADFG